MDDSTGACITLWPAGTSATTVLSLALPPVAKFVQEKAPMFHHYFQQYPSYYALYLAVVVVVVVAIYIVLRNAKGP